MVKHLIANQEMRVRFPPFAFGVTMKEIYAVMILHKAQHKIDESSIKKVLEAANVEVDEIRIKALVNSLEGVDIGKAIANRTIPVQPITAPIDKKEVIEEEIKEDVMAEQAASGLDRLFG